MSTLRSRMKKVIYPLLSLSLLPLFSIAQETKLTADDLFVKAISVSFSDGFIPGRTKLIRQEPSSQNWTKRIQVMKISF